MDIYEVSPRAVTREHLQEKCSELEKSLRQSLDSHVELKKEYDRLKAELRTIADRLKMAIDACEGLNAEKDVLEKQVGSLKKDLETSREEATAVNQTLSRKNDELKTMVKATERDREKLEELKTKKKRTDSKVKDMGKFIKDLEMKTNCLETEIKKNNELSVKIRALEANGQKKDQVIDGLRDKKQIIESELSEKQKLTDDLRNKVEYLEELQRELKESHTKRVDTLQLDVKDVTARYDKLQEQAEKVKLSEKSTKKQHDELQENHNLLTNKIKVLEKDKKRLETVKQEISEDKVKLEKENWGLQKAREKLITENERLLLTLTEVKNQVATLQEENEELSVCKDAKDKLETDYKDLKTTLGQIREDVGAVNEAKEEVIRQHKMIKSRYDDSMQELGRVKEAKEDLEKRHQDLLSYNEEGVKEKSKLKARLEKSEKSLVDAEEKCKSLTEEIQQSEKSQSMIVMQLTELKNAYNKTKDELNSFKEENEKKSKELTVLSEKYDLVTKKLQAANKSKEEARNDVVILKIDLENTKDELNNLQDIKNKLEIDHDDLTKKFNEAGCNLQKAQVETYKLENELSELDTQNSCNKKQLQNKVAEFEELKSIYDKLKQSNIETERDLTMLTSEKEALDHEHQELKGQYSQVKHQLEITSNKLAQKVADLLELQGKYTQTRNTLEGITATKQQLEREVADLKEEFNSLKQDLKNKENDLFSLKSEHLELEDIQSETKDQLTKTQTKLESLTEEHSELKGKYSQTKLELSNLSEIKILLDEECNDLKGRYHQIKEELGTTKTALALSENNYKEILKKHEQISQNLDDTQDQKQLFENKSSEMEEKYKEAQQEISVLCERRNLLEKEYNHLHNELNTTKSTLVSTESAKAAIEEKLSEANEELKTISRELDDTRDKRDQIENQYIELNTTFTQTTVTLTNTQEARNQLEGKLNALNESYDLSRKELNALTSDKLALEKKHTSLAEHHSKIEEEFSQTRNSLEKGKQLYIELVAVQSKTKQALDVTSALKENLEKENSKIKAAYEQANGELLKMRTKHDKLLQEFKETSRELGENIKMLVTGRETTETLQKELTELKKQFSKNVHENLVLQESNKDLEQSNNQLKAQIDKAKCSLESMRQEKDELRNNYDKYKRDTESDLQVHRDSKKKTADRESSDKHQQRQQITEQAYKALIDKYDTLRKANEALKMQILSGHSQEISVEALMGGGDSLAVENARLLQEKGELQTETDRARLDKQALEERLADQHKAIKDEVIKAESKEEDFKRLLETTKQSKEKVEAELLKQQEEFKTNLSKARMETLVQVLQGDLDPHEIVSQMSDAEKKLCGVRGELRIQNEEKDLVQLRAEHLAKECKMYEKHIEDLERQVEIQRIQIQDAMHEHKETVKVLGELCLEQDLTRMQHENDVSRIEEDVKNLEAQIIPEEDALSAISVASTAKKPKRFNKRLMLSPRFDQVDSVNFADVSTSTKKHDYDDDDRIKSNLGPEEDGHKALEIKHFKMLDELVQLRNDLGTEREKHRKKVQDLEDTILLERKRNETMNLTDLSHSQMHVTFEPTPGDLYTVKEKLLMLMKNNTTLNQDNMLLQDRLRQQENLVRNIQSCVDGANTSINSTSLNTSIVRSPELINQQITLLQQQRDELQQKLTEQKERNQELAALREDKRYLEDKVQNKHEMFRQKCREKELLEVQLLQEQLSNERQTRQYHKLQELLRKKNNIQHQLDQSRTFINQSFQQNQSVASLSQVNFNESLKNPPGISQAERYSGQPVSTTSHSIAVGTSTDLPLFDPNLSCIQPDGGVLNILNSTAFDVNPMSSGSLHSTINQPFTSQQRTRGSAFNQSYSNTINPPPYDPANIFQQKVAFLEKEMERVLTEIDMNLSSRDMNVQVGDTAIPKELYKRQEIITSIRPVASQSLMSFSDRSPRLACGCKVGSLSLLSTSHSGGHNASLGSPRGNNTSLGSPRGTCSYHSAVENLRVHLGQQSPGAVNKTRAKVTPRR